MKDRFLGGGFACVHRIYCVGDDQAKDGRVRIGKRGARHLTHMTCLHRHGLTGSPPGAASHDDCRATALTSSHDCDWARKDILEVPDSGKQPDDRLLLSDLPLGPWAGADIDTWASKTGVRWHGDPECSNLRSRARHQRHLQPSSGSMADIQLPERLHCPPSGDLGTYREAASKLVAFDATTFDAAQSLRGQDLDLNALDTTISGTASLFNRVSPVKAVLEREPLAGYWERCRDRRTQLARDIRRHFEDRGPMMLAAAWIADGRTPRQHQPRYKALLRVAEKECEQRAINATLGIRNYANDEVLPQWLYDVSGGLWPSTCTERLVAEEVERARQWNRTEPEDFFTKVQEAWSATGEAWTQILKGIAIAHPGEVFALFHDHQPGLNWNLRDLFDTVIPHARLTTREFAWVAARVPAIFRVFLSERDHGLMGLVLHDERTQQFDTSTAALFLRNLVTDLGSPDLAQHVREHDIDAGDPHEDDGDVPACPTLHWQLHGFGAGITDAGLTRERCLPALRAALNGQELKPPKTSRRRHT